MRLFSVLFALLCLAVGSQANAEGDDYKAPRGPGGVHPDLNGIWQALGSAHYDIEMHTASHSMQLREGPRAKCRQPVCCSCWASAGCSSCRHMHIVLPVWSPVRACARGHVSAPGRCAGALWWPSSAQMPSCAPSPLPPCVRWAPHAHQAPRVEPCERHGNHDRVQGADHRPVARTGANYSSGVTPSVVLQPAVTPFSNLVRTAIVVDLLP